ncbi:MAG: Stp1/IreP family PP2C-type Ser/Thr phosphatase [Terracidiphilus sp.]
MSPTPTLSVDFAAVTDVGCVRQNNEDSYGFDSDHHLYVVCDGMGGCAAGEVASGLAVRTLIDAFASSAAESEPVPLELRLMNAIVGANQAVYEAGAGDPALQSMGTTLVCACLDGDRAVIGNVGDSRAYLVRGRKCAQITLDHSFVEEQIRAGNLPTDRAATSNLQSVITRAIGVEETVEPDLFEARLQPADALLLVSDGLTRYLQPEDILLAIADGADLSAICRNMIDFAKAKGGVDNITCLLVRVTAFAEDH